MPWKEDGAKDEGPDLDEIISKIKEIFRSVKSRIAKVSKDADPGLLELSCSCDNDSENKNKIVDVIVYCEACSTQIAKKTITEPFKVAAILAVLAYGTSQFVEYVITDNRYPTRVEFEITRACVSSSQSALRYKSYKEKLDICLCALEDTMNEISYIRFKIDDDGFLKAFRKNTKECK
jgi:hypothetical protein